MEKYEKLIKIIVIILILIIILIVVLLKNLNKIQELNSEYEAEEGLELVRDESIKDVQSPTMFYTVKDILIKYLGYVHVDYTKEEVDERYPTLASKYDITNEQEKLNEIMKLLDVKYIKENNITIDNIKNYFTIDNDEVLLSDIIEMKVLEEQQFQFYIINVDVTTESSNKYNEYYVITLDEYNSTWMIRPIKDCNNIDEIEIDKEVQDINDNNINNYSYNRVTDEDMSQRYFTKYKQLILNNTEKAYEKLDENYREKRFNNYEEFKKFVNTNREELEKISIEEYLVEEYEDYKQYVCKDSFENIYIFKATSVVDYTVELDTYTIVTDKFKETYNESDEQKKVMMNIDKWIQMLNNRDYTTAFNMLDETFRNNNFNGDVNNFETFIRDKYPSHYKVEYNSFSKLAGETYSQKIILSEIGAVNSENKEITIFMKLKENIEFSMSFTIE